MMRCFSLLVKVESEPLLIYTFMVRDVENCRTRRKPIGAFLFPFFPFFIKKKKNKKHSALQQNLITSLVGSLSWLHFSHVLPGNYCAARQVGTFLLLRSHTGGLDCRLIFI